MERVGYKEAIQTEWLKFIPLEKVVEVIAQNIFVQIINMEPTTSSCLVSGWNRSEAWFLRVHSAWQASSWWFPSQLFENKLLAAGQWQVTNLTLRREWVAVINAKQSNPGRPPQIPKLPIKDCKIFCWSLCLFLSVCFPVTNKIWLNPT